MLARPGGIDEYATSTGSSRIALAASLLPGAATEFALIFSVPQGITPKALVFSIMMYPDDIGKTKFTNVRVVLSE